MEPERRALLLLHLARLGRPPPWPLPETAALLEADVRGLRSLGLSRGDAHRIVDLRSRRGEAHEEQRADRLGARILFHDDPDFPERLRGEPPETLVLYARGERLPKAPRVTIVGSRLASSPLCSFAADLGAACAAAGVAVVSGLAYGIDAAAHRGCLRAAGTPVGVLGTGLDRAYPERHASLHEEVARSGLLLTPFPLGSEPRPHHFPRRNRILAALADAVVVVRAGERSGSLATAEAALDRGVDVWAVPGSPLDPLSAGTNRLLRDGAAPLVEAADLLLALTGRWKPSPPDSSERPPHCDDDALLRHLGPEPLTLEEIAAASRTPPGRLRERLVELELAGVVERTAGAMYRLRRGGSG